MPEKETKKTDELISPEPSKQRSDRIRLLLVDDEEGYVNVLSNRLAKRNIDVTKALSGSEAIQALRKQDFDVALLDLKMEDMDGLEVLRIFKKMYPQMAVIMLTGHGSAENSRLGIKLGAYDYIMKPCEFEELLNIVRNAYQKQKSKSEHE